MSENSQIGISRKQKVFCLTEDTFGTLQFPNATNDFIRAAGDAIINQNPAFNDSLEKQNTLDVLDRFQSTLPAALWSIPMYIRPTGTVGESPQGHSLFRSLQGSLNASTAASIDTDPGATVGTIVIKTIAGGTLPEIGVVTVGTESIKYTSITRASRDATTATLLNCERGYASSSAASHSSTATVTLSSVFYKQTVKSPSMSLWIETDHFIQGLKGASVDEAIIEVTNEGAVMITFSGQGMEMVFAGTTALSSSNAATNTHIHVTDASLFSAGAHVYNETKASTNATITSVDRTGNILHLAHATGAIWTTGDVIKGFLPAVVDVIGDPIESRDTVLEISGVTGVIKSGSISIKSPKTYLIDEVGLGVPSDFMEEVRDISSSMKVYFRKAAAKYFADGLAGDTNTMRFTFGDTAGSILELYFPKVVLEVPAIEFAAPAVELSLPMKALGTVGEDSCEIVLC